jgi:hypothetical protein
MALAVYCNAVGICNRGKNIVCLVQVWFPTNTEPWGANLLEQSLATGDTVTNALYFIVVTACAPLWEEVCTFPARDMTRT